MTSTWWRRSRWTVGSSRTISRPPWARPCHERRADARPSTARGRRGPEGGRCRPGRGRPRRPPDRPGPARAAGARGACARARRRPRPASRTAARPGRARPRRGARAGSRDDSATGTPSSSTSRRSGARPVRQRRRLVLPAPLGPTRQTRSPAPTGRSMSRSACRDAVGQPTRARELDRRAVTARTRPGIGAAARGRHGAPTTAVTTPTGISPGMRATRSARTRNAAPNSAESGSTRRAFGPDEQPHDVRARRARRSR